MKQSDLLTITGVDQWVIDEEINADFPDPAKPRWPLASEGKGRLEDDYEQNIRSRMWAYLTSIIPKPMWSSLIELYVKGIYVALRTVNRSNAITEGTELRAKLATLSEKSKPMMSWLDDMWACMDDLDKLRQPVSTEQVRQIIYAAIKDDKRYADFKRDFLRHPEIDINKVKEHLLEAAREMGDLVGDPKLIKKSLKAARAVEADKLKVGAGEQAHPVPKV